MMKGEVSDPRGKFVELEDWVGIGVGDMSLQT